MSSKKNPHERDAHSILRNILQKDHLPHALLFQGSAGAGQKETALWLAKHLFCENKKAEGPCDACVQCRQVDQRSHPDLLILGPDESSRVIKIETIRELIARANFKPFQAHHKVFVIEEAEAMNDVAQNALLKTLEEPEGNTVFILISSGLERLLPTIRSRCQVLNFLPKPVPQEADAELETVKQEVLEFILDERGASHEAPDLTKLEREPLAGVLDFLIEYFRDVLLVAVNAKELISVGGASLQKNKLVGGSSPEELEERIEILSRTKEKILNSMNVRITLAAMWSALKT